jgi:hypothetical protein
MVNHNNYNNLLKGMAKKEDANQWTRTHPKTKPELVYGISKELLGNCQGLNKQTASKRVHT